MQHKVDHTSPTLSIHRASKLFFREMEIALTSANLRYSQWVALVLIHENLARTASAVANCMGFHAGAVTRLLDRLEHDGYLTRFRDGRDRRIVLIRLTKPGRAAVETGRRLVERRWSALLSSFSSTEIKQFTKVLATVSAHAASSPSSTLRGLL